MTDDAYSDLIGDELYEMPAFYLTTHIPSWLTWSPVPLMVSRRRLEERARLPRAVCSWALDSGGFSELDMYGEWRLHPDRYLEFVARCERDIGRLDFSGQMDWMCEQKMLAKTGRKVRDHQLLTVENFCYLEEHWPQHSDDSSPFLPTLQGDKIDEYLECVDLFEAAGVDLFTREWVGLGSVCRRQATDEIVALVRALWPLPLHGFGMKTLGAQVGQLLKSMDSMAWSLRGTHVPGCSPTHAHENNCPRFAYTWRSGVLEALGDTDDYYRRLPTDEAARRLPLELIAA